MGAEAAESLQLAGTGQCPEFLPMFMKVRGAGFVRTGLDCTRRSLITVFRTLPLYGLFLIAPLSAAQADNVGRLQRLLSLSGIADIVTTFPEQIHRQLHRPDTVADSDTVAAVEQRLRSAYSSMDMMAVLNDYVASRLSSNQLDSILAWYDSPLGRRLAEAERQAETAAGREGMQAFLTEFDKQPVARERVRLVRRFEEAGRLARINLAVMRALYETEFVAVNALRPSQARLDGEHLQAQMQQQFYDVRELILPGLAVNMMAISYYTLRSFNNSEISSYIAFLESGNGQALLDLYEDVPVYLLGQLVSHAGIPVPTGFFRTTHVTRAD
jgi:hypothetical protein